MTVLNRQFIFIIGAPRSGTTWLQNMLSNHQDVASLVNIEQTIFSGYIAPLVNRWELEQINLNTYDWKQGLPVIWSEKDFENQIKYFVENAYYPILKSNPEASHILDKHPGYANHLDIINRVLPNAKFIHLVRDGREVVSSIMRSHKVAGFGDHEIYGATQRWKRNTLNARKAAEFGKHRYLEMHYNDLKSDMQSNLKMILKFCNLKANDKVVQDILRSKSTEKVSFPNRNNNSSDNLTLKERYVFNQIAGELLLDLNMESTSSWWAKNKFQWLYARCRFGAQKIWNGFKTFINRL